MKNCRRYSTLSKACLLCPFNTTDCQNHDCIPANGVSRAVISVNRMIPGPAINVCEFDEIKVVVKNKLHSFEGTSIHWYLKKSV
jgi:L-ascorbate oxidase